jgi:hypothetical protein
MVIYNLGEKDIQSARVVLASFGIFAANMGDIDAMGIPDPEEHSRHIEDWKSNDGKTEYKAYCPIDASQNTCQNDLNPLTQHQGGKFWTKPNS